MTGSFGNEQRGWIALLEYDGKTGSDGVLWVAGSQDDVTSYRLDEASGLFRWVRKRGHWHYGNAREGTLVHIGDWLYYCGAGKWRRVDLKNGREDVLVDDPRALPGYGSGNGWLLANSSHYGLVAFASR